MNKSQNVLPSLKNASSNEIDENSKQINDQSGEKVSNNSPEKKSQPQNYSILTESL